MESGDGNLFYLLGDKVAGIFAAVVSALVAVRAYVWREESRRETINARLMRLENAVDTRPTHNDYTALIEKIGVLDGRIQKAEYGLTHVSTDLSRIVASISRIESLLMSHRLPREDD